MSGRTSSAAIAVPVNQHDARSITWRFTEFFAYGRSCQRRPSVYFAIRCSPAELVRQGYAQVESDEYAVISNQGGAAVNLAGWRLNAGDPGQDFVFPAWELQPGQSCRVYTNEIHPETCGFSFGRSQAIWNNSGDCGYLFDSSGNQVSQYCY